MTCTRECVYCRENFTFTYTRGRKPMYCRDLCQKMAYSSRKGRLPKGTVVAKRCVGCRKVFEYRHTDGRKRVYCRRKCQEQNKERPARVKKKLPQKMRCGCNRDYLSVPLEDAGKPCPHPKLHV